MVRFLQLGVSLPKREDDWLALEAGRRKAKPPIFFRRKTEMVPISQAVWVLQEAVIPYGQKTSVKKVSKAAKCPTSAVILSPETLLKQAWNATSSAKTCAIRP